jgi:hypothetical protein
MKVHFQAYKGKETFKQVSPLWRTKAFPAEFEACTVFSYFISQILMQPMLLERIIGPDMLSSYMTSKSDGENSFFEQVVRSFLNTLVQTLNGSVRDIKEFVRIGRGLWPLYVQPLHSDKLDETLRSVQKIMPSSLSTKNNTQTNGKHILAFLDQQILPQIRSTLEHGLYSLAEEEPQRATPTPSTTSSANNPIGSFANQIVPSRYDASRQAQIVSPDSGKQDLAYLGKCLMLAAFICQHNKADRDKQLFTIQKNGKKNNANKRKSPGEDLAYGTSQNSAPKSFRPRLFPMERMLSIFVSIVGLNQQNEKAGGSSGQRQRGSEIKPAKIGSSDFFENLATLRDIGVLRDKANVSAPGGATSMDTINMSAPRYWCTLTKDEADHIARSVNFPLEDYLYKC